jgi:hypothetical protein
MEANIAGVGGSMIEIGPQHGLGYRQEVLSPFFSYIQSADSFYLVGAASIGKTRLLDHLMRPDVQEYYLKDKATQCWLIRVDLNRMPANDPSWAFYELLVSSILLSLHEHENVDSLATELTKLDSDIIQKRDPLLALRYFELIINKLCQIYEWKLCFLLDEFDEAYKTLPREIFLQLRAVRDANKYRVCYGLFMRNLPEILRDPNDNESFYELLSRHPIGIGPYAKLDALETIHQWEARKQHPITIEQREAIFQAGGGHPGLMQALLGVFIIKPYLFQELNQPAWKKILLQESAIADECRKIWAGLFADEQKRLPAFLTDEYKNSHALVDTQLYLKGLIRARGSETDFFSNLFEEFVRGQC